MSLFDEVLTRLKDNLVSPLSKIEGTFTMFNLRSVAKEFARWYNEKKIVQDNYSLDTATGLYLDAKSLDYGVTRQYAQPTWGEVTFTGNDGVKIPSGTLLLAPDYSVQFSVVGDYTISNGSVNASVKCLVPGSAGNIPENTLTSMVNPIAGVSSVTNANAFSGGTDKEDDESFRDRIFYKIRYPATSGNVYHYVQWATEVNGVGKVKVKPLWNGPGTVKVSILDSNGDPAEQPLLDAVEEHIDPEPKQHGEGEAPVGALVTISTATEKVVNISATVTMVEQGNLEEAKTAFSQALDDYFHEIAYDNKTYTLSVARVGYYLLETPNVVDYTNLTLNGGTSTLTIRDEEIFKMGEVTLSPAGGGG